MWYDDQLRRGKTIVFGPETECKPRQFTDPGSVESGRDLEWADSIHDTQARAATWLMAPPAARLAPPAARLAPPAARLESPAADVGAGPAADAEERDLFNCLHWLRDLFGTLGGGGDEDSAGVPEPGELWNERYQVLEPLGSGAAGHVCLAYDQQMRRQVALKFPRVESGSWGDRREDLLRDAQMAARFDHRGILPVHELVIPAHGSPCLVMPHCRGGSLRAWLRAHPQPLDPRLCVRLLCDLAEAVQYAHDRRVVHRDLKPENILLQSRRGMAAEGTTAAGTPPERLLDEWQPRIADFGLAVVHDTGSSAADTPYPMGGTLRYMAPEQMRGEVTALGPATDVYALGVVLKELLVGQKPTRSARAPARDPDPDCSRTIPRDVSRIIARCTAHDPQHRYATVADLQADLRRWERDEPVHAGQTPGRVEWFRKWSVRRRRPLGLGVLGLIGLWGALLLARMPSSLEREWSRWGQIPTDFPFAGIEQSGNGSVHLDPKSGQLVIVSSRARMAQLGNLPPGGDLDLSLDLELFGRVDDCGVFFGYRDQQPTPDDPGCARMHAVSVCRKLDGLIPRLYVRRNVAYFLRDGRFHYSAMGQLREWSAPQRGEQNVLRRRKVRLRLQIQNGILQEISVNGQPLPEFTDPSVDQEIEEFHDLNLSGAFGVFVNGSTTVQFGLPEQNQLVNSFR